MGAEPADELLRGGWQALADTEWERARVCFEQALELSESAEALDGLGRALHFQAEYTRAIELTERAFAAYRDRGNVVEAADRGRWLAFLHGAINGNMAVASGWMARAETVLEQADECAGHGWLALDRAPFTEDAAERGRLAAAALAIARRFADVDLEYDALALLGESYVASGRVVEGMRLLDEAMTAVSAGEVAGIVAVGDIYCRLLSACETTLDVMRAEQWMSVAGHFEAWGDFVPPVCRTHYAGILTAVGRWDEAEEHLLSSIRTFEASYRLMRGSAIVRLADLRVRQGRFDEARHLLEGHESDPVARGAMASIAFGRGELALADDLVRLCLDGRQDASDPACAPTLDLHVQVKLARDDPEGAAEAANRLAALAAESEDRGVAAFAEMAIGRVATAAGDDTASQHVQAAIRAFSELGLQFEEARAHLVLAGALAASAPEAATAEARLALRTFERVGAARDADAAAGLLRALGLSGRTWPQRYGALTKRETEVLSLLAEGCSNADIAARLYISKRTAEHHVAHILSKLGVRNRAEAAAYAVRQQEEDR
jgi:DNA-binding NarL/FixJ family response regulator